MGKISRARFLGIAAILIVAAPLYAADPQEVSPSGYKLLLFLALLLLLLFFPGRKLRNLFPSFGSPRLHARLRKEGEGSAIVYVVTLSNRSRKPIELDAPYLRFAPLFSRRGSKTFRVRPQGGHALFPLALYPGTSYSFRVPVSLFIDNEDSGARFARLVVESRMPDGKLLAAITRRCRSRG